MILIGMSARKLVYKLMVCAPAIFMAGLGVHARTMESDFDFVANDTATESRIQAYVPFVREAADVMPSRNPAVWSGVARSVARDWARAAEKCDLRPLHPISYDDTSSDGVKSQVFETEARIEVSLRRAVADDLQRNDLNAATADTVLILRLANVLKLSDFASMFTGAAQQRHALQVIEPYIGMLSNLDRKALAQELPRLSVRRSTTEEMVVRSKQLFLTWRKRTACDPLSIEDTQILSDIPALVNGDHMVTMEQLRMRLLTLGDDKLPEYCSALRVGILSQDRLTKTVEKLSSQLAK